ncbi:MAG: hypothetical protein JWN23_1134 [Rhodocyclales bacterium]|nr:hypothetical protein [Rhodocyclales bacterium]
MDMREKIITSIKKALYPDFISTKQELAIADAIIAALREQATPIYCVSCDDVSSDGRCELYSHHTEPVQNADNTVLYALPIPPVEQPESKQVACVSLTPESETESSLSLTDKTQTPSADSAEVHDAERYFPHEFEVWQNDILCASGSGTRQAALTEAIRYARQYQEDGPVRVFEVTRTLIDHDAAIY